MKRLLALVLAAVLAFALCIPTAAHSQEYWEGYTDGWDEGSAAGSADAAAGAEREIGPETYEDGYGAGYNDGYDSGYEDALWSQESDSEREQFIRDALTKHGGEYGSNNVMIDGACVQFSGVQPENVGGHIMVPARTTLETLGAQVTYDAGTLTVQLGGDTVRHVVGTDTAERTQAGSDAPADVITLPCKSYIKNGCTMIPVLFISDALGYDVSWDPGFKTAVVLDTEAFTEETDSKLTILNLLLADQAAAMRTDKTLCRSTSLDLDLTLFDTLNGDRHLSASANAQSLIGSAAVNGSVQIDLSDIMDLLAEEGYFTDDENISAELQKSLRPLKADVIYNRQTNQMYIQSALLDDYVGEGAWLQSSMEDFTGALSLDDMLSAATVGGMLTTQITQASYDSALLWYDDLHAAADQIIAVLGDQNFTTSGSTSTLTLDKDKVMKLLGSEDEDDLDWDYGLSGEISLSLRVTKTGETSCDYALTAEIRNDDWAAKLNDTKTGQKENMTFNLHVKNVFQATLTGQATTTQSSASVQTEPPVGAVTLDPYRDYVTQATPD